MNYFKCKIFFLYTIFLSAVLSLAGCFAKPESAESDSAASGSAKQDFETAASVEEKLRQTSNEFKEKYSSDTAYDTYIADGFSESYTDRMTTEQIHFESSYFCGASGADIRRIDADGNGGYILTYIYGINNNEQKTDETKPAGGTVAEADWSIGVLTYNTISEVSEYAYYNGMYEEYFYEDGYTCRYLHDNLGNTCFLFGYKQ